MEKSKRGVKDERSYFERLDAAAKLRYSTKLMYICGNDPYEVPTRLWSASPDDYPSLDYIAIVNYFVYGVSAYTTKEFRSHKSLTAYKNFVDGWVREIETFTPDGCDHSAVRAKVLHSQRLNEKPLQTWLITHNQEIVTGHCTCMAGVGESCTHMAALAFALESFAQVKERPTCTGVKAYWKVPHGVKGVEPAPAHKIDFTSSKAKKKVLEKYLADDGAAAPLLRQKKVPAAAACAPSAEELKNFFSKLNMHATKETAPSILKVHPDYCMNFKAEDPVACPDLPAFPSMKALHDPACEKLGKDQLLEHCRQIVLSKPTEIQIKELEESTRDQAQSNVWFQARQGRITASNMHAACHTNPDQPGKTLIADICADGAKPGFDPKNRVPAIQGGKENESRALSVYCADARKSHDEFTCRNSGFYLSSEYPFLGASPDAVIECKCCGTGCVEVKCPYTKRVQTVEEMVQDHKFCLSVNADGSIGLRHDHAFYYQVQCQLLVTGFAFCDFVVWSLKGVHVIRVFPDQVWRDVNLPKVTRLFRVAVLPEVVGLYFSRMNGEKRPTPLSPVKMSPSKKVKA